MKNLGKNHKKAIIDPQLGKDSIRQDALDHRLFEQMLSDNPKVEEFLYEDVGDSYPPYRNLLQDANAALFKYTPELVPEQEIELEYLLNQKIMEEITESPKYKELRVFTRVDHTGTVMGLETLAQELKEVLKKAQEQQQALEDLQKAQQAMQQAQQAADGEGEGDEDGTPGTGNDSSKYTLEEAKQALEEARKNFDDSVNQKEFKGLIAKSLKNTMNTVQETHNFITNWGLDSDPGYQKMSHHEKTKLLQKMRNNRKLAQIAKLAGRYMALAVKKQAEKLKPGSNELHDLTTGSEIQKAIPAEKALLGHRVAKYLTYQKMVDHKLTVYETKDKVKEQQGPIVMACDESGSMSGSGEIWAKSVALGMLEIAIRQKRDFLFIHFSGDSNPKGLKVDTFYGKDGKNMEKIIEMCEYFDGGKKY